MVFAIQGKLGMLPKTRWHHWLHNCSDGGLTKSGGAFSGARCVCSLHSCELFVTKKDQKEEKSLGSLFAHVHVLFSLCCLLEMALHSAMLSKCILCSYAASAVPTLLECTWCVSSKRLQVLPVCHCCGDHVPTMCLQFPITRSLVHVVTACNVENQTWGWYFIVSFFAFKQLISVSSSIHLEK